MKLTHLSLAVMVALGLVACGGSDTDHTKPPTPPTKPDPKPEPKPEDDKDAQDPTKLEAVVGFDMTKKASTGSLQQVRETKASFNRSNNPLDVNRVQATSIVSIPLNPNLHDVVVAQIDGEKHDKVWVRTAALGTDNILVGGPNVRTTAPPKAVADQWQEVKVSAYSVAAQREKMKPEITATIQMSNDALRILEGDPAGPPPIRSSNVVFPSAKVGGEQHLAAQIATLVEYDKAKHEDKDAGRYIEAGNAYIVDPIQGRIWKTASDEATRQDDQQRLGPVWLNHLGQSIASEDHPKTKAGVRVMGHKYHYVDIYKKAAKGHLEPNSFSQATVVTLGRKGKVRISEDFKLANVFGDGITPDKTAADDTLTKAAWHLTDKTDVKSKLKIFLDAEKNYLANTADASLKDKYETALKEYNKELDKFTWEDDRYALRLDPMTLNHVQYGRVTGRLDKAGRVRYVQVGNKWILEHRVANKNSKESVDTYFYRGLGATSPENMAKLKAANENAKLLYKGHAIMYGVSNAFGDDNAIPNATGTSPGHGVGHLVEATFDVGQQKVVDGIVYNAWLTDTSNANSFTKDVLVKFEGDVTGNTVLGDSWLAKNEKAPKGDFRGSFYGPSAAELGGAFNSVRSPKKGEKDASPYGPYGWGGVFGAKRDVAAPTVGVIPKFEEGK